MNELNQAARYYVFIKWFKANYREYYLLYAVHITVPGDDLLVQVSLDYIAPEHKQPMLNIVAEFNASAKDDHFL